MLQLGGPPLPAVTLDGESIRWRPGGVRNHLVVFCALGHPACRKFLAEAQDGASGHGARLAAFSIDWSLAQARREATAADVPIRFAGPGGLELHKTWSPTSPAKAFLISGEQNPQRSRPGETA